MKRKKILKILLIFFILILLIVNITNAFSLGDLSGNTKSTKEIQDVGNKAVTIVSTIGSILSVIVIIVLGIKYMLGSVEEKAEYKKTLLPYIIGAALIFAASAIAQIIYELAIQIGKWYNINGTYTKPKLVKK